MADIKDFKEALKLAIDLSEEKSTKMVMLDLFDVFYSAAYSDGQRYMIDEHSCAEVVRCKDCRHCTFSDGEELADCMIKQGWFPVKPDWFCADGERKEGR